ncbi:MAG: alpha/beta hydrolase, partial [Alphaproteobacteria bacterium]
EIRNLMPNWKNPFSEGFSRLLKPRVALTKDSLETLRQQYDEMHGQWGAVPDDAVAERAKLGQIKGEWLRVADTQPDRLIFYLHGGGYVSGSPESCRSLVARLCKASGAAALVVNYRLGPEFPFPAALRDAVDAYRFLISKGFSANSIVFAGDGSGGGLAFATMIAARNAGLPMPAACATMSPWADLTLSGWSIMENAHKDNYLSWDTLFTSARHYLQKASPADVYASPVFGAFHDLPPIMVHTGSREILRDDASKIGELAAAANVPVSVEIYDGMHHVFQAYPNASDAKVSLGRLGQFIRTHTPELKNSGRKSKVSVAGGVANSAKH